MKKDFDDYSSALLQKIPSAMVVVDERLKVIEANEAFVKMWAIDMLDVFNSFDEGIQDRQRTGSQRLYWEDRPCRV